MSKVYGLISAALILAHSPLARADEVAVNGGFETAGVGGATDSAGWLQLAPGAPGTLSMRDATSPRTGGFAQHIRAVGATGLGSSGILIQNSIAEAGLPSLQQSTTLSAVFSAKVALGPGGVGFYALRILNGDGTIVAGTPLLSMTDTAGMYRTFSMGPLTVPAFGPPPNDVYASFLELVVSAGAFPASTADAFIDDVSITGTLISICTADFNQSGSITVQDIFDFLTAYFSNSAAADFNSSGDVSVQDIFDYLAAYFTGCS